MQHIVLVGINEERLDHRRELDNQLFVHMCTGDQILKYNSHYILLRTE